MFRIQILVGALACALTACTPLSLAGALASSPAAATPAQGSPTSAAVEAVSGKVVLEATRAFALAEIAYSAANASATAGVKSGIIKGATATKLRELNQQATFWLMKGYSASSDIERAQAAAKLFNIRDAIAAFLPGVK